MITLEDARKITAAAKSKAMEPKRPMSRAAAEAGGYLVTDYRAAIDRAVEWLGDRYLLAQAIPRKAHGARLDQHAAVGAGSSRGQTA